MALATTKRIQIREIFVELGNLWPKDIKNNREKAVVSKHWLQRMRILDCIESYFIYIMVNVAIFEIMPLLVSCYYMCQGVDEYYYPFELFESWKPDSVLIFLLTYIWQVVSTAPSQLCLYYPFGILIIVLTLDISLLFRLLQIDLENAIEVRDDSEVTKQLYTLDRASYQRIEMIASKHQRLLRLAHKLSNIFGVVIFVHIAFSSITICFYGFLTMVYGGLAESITNLLTVLNAIIAIFLLSLAGEVLSDTSTNIAEAAYRSAWYECDNRVRTLIKLIIVRAQHPSYLSALGYSNLTFRSFSKIMSTAWTYFTILIQLYSGK